MKAVSTVAIATLLEPKTWCRVRVQSDWKIRLEAPEAKKATYASHLVWGLRALGRSDAWDSDTEAPVGHGAMATRKGGRPGGGRV
jgi:hypothetical protein